MKAMRRSEMTPKNSNHDITVRPAAKSDQEAIVAEWRSVYPDEFRFKFPDRWHWQFEANPFLCKHCKDELPIWVAVSHGQIVGWSCAMIVASHVLGMRLPLGFGIDMHVKASHRRKNIGLRLQEENQKKHPIFLSIQMSEGSRKIKTKIGGQTGPPFKIYLRLSKVFDGELLYKSVIGNPKYKYVAGYGRMAHAVFHGIEFKMISWILSFIFKRKQKKSIPSKLDLERRRLRFERLEAFDAEATQFWNKVKHDYGFAVVRDEQYLNWKYTHQPHMNYDKFYVKDESEIVGILVFRLGTPPELEVGVITEIVAVKNQIWIYEQMLNFADHALQAGGALAIRCGSSTDELDSALSRAGFRLMEYKVPVIHVDKDMVAVDEHRLKKVPWLMSLGDQDLDIPLLNQQASFGDIVRVLTGRILGQQYL